MKHVISIILFIALVSCGAEVMDDVSVKQLVYKSFIEHIEAVMKGSEGFTASKIIPNEITVAESKVDDANTRNFHVKGWLECIGADDKMGKHSYSLEVLFMDDFIEAGATLIGYSNEIVDKTVIPN